MFDTDGGQDVVRMMVRVEENKRTGSVSITCEECGVSTGFQPTYGAARKIIDEHMKMFHGAAGKIKARDLSPREMPSEIRSDAYGILGGPQNVPSPMINYTSVDYGKMLGSPDYFLSSFHPENFVKKNKTVGRIKNTGSFLDWVNEFGNSSFRY